MILILLMDVIMQTRKIILQKIPEKKKKTIYKIRYLADGKPNSYFLLLQISHIQKYKYENKKK